MAVRGPSRPRRTVAWTPLQRMATGGGRLFGGGSRAPRIPPRWDFSRAGALQGPRCVGGTLCPRNLTVNTVGAPMAGSSAPPGWPPLVEGLWFLRGAPAGGVGSAHTSCRVRSLALPKGPCIGGWTLPKRTSLGGVSPRALAHRQTDRWTGDPLSQSCESLDTLLGRSNRRPFVLRSPRASATCSRGGGRPAAPPCRSVHFLPAMSSVLPPCHFCLPVSHRDT